MTEEVRCPTCGARVEVVTNGEGDSSYRSIADEELQAKLEAVSDARLIAQRWLRSSDRDVRMMGADLLQVLADEEGEA